jgi:hypothetical protein
MTLTKSDLLSIDKIVIKRVQPLDKKLINLEKGQAKLEKGQKKIQKDLKTIVNSFDSEYLGLKKRVVKIETHLDLQPPEF